MDFLSSHSKKKNLEDYNDKIKELSKDRASSYKWQDSRIVADKIEIVNDCDRQQTNPLLALADAEKWLRYALMVFT